jgi:serine/threonine protein kinase
MNGFEKFKQGKSAGALEQFLKVTPNAQLAPGLEPADGVDEDLALLEEAFQASERLDAGYSRRKRQPLRGAEPAKVLCKVGGEFWAGRMLAQGAMGKVWVGTSGASSDVVALKTVGIAGQQVDLPRVEEELRIHRRCDHPCIIQLREVLYLPSTLAYTMDYAAQGDLLVYLKEQVKLVEDDARRLFGQLAQGVKYLHQDLSVIHRDIKPENLLLAAGSDGLSVKIADFGVAVEDYPRGRHHTLQCGTPSYMSPELIAGRPYVGGPVDVWAMGVVLYAMLRGSLPFKGDTMDALRKAITNDPVQIQGSVDAVDLVRGLLAQDPEKRLKIAAICTHGFLRPRSGARRQSSGPPDGPAGSWSNEPTSGMGPMGSQMASFGGFSQAPDKRETTPDPHQDRRVS